MLKRFAFTLAEVLIVVGIIGIVAEMTIPTLVSSVQDQAYVAGVNKFNSALNQAVMLWKQDINCMDSATNCLVAQNLVDNDVNSFDQIAKFMKITSTEKGSKDNVAWLPDTSYNYYGNVQTGSYNTVSKDIWMNAYLLSDGTTFTVDSNEEGFEVTIDVNGKKSPNRQGKDIFIFSVGNFQKSDVSYYPMYSNDTSDNTLGLCGRINTSTWGAANCNPNNVNPTVGEGASPTAYVILNKKLPDFNALSKTVAGFKP